MNTIYLVIVHSGSYEDKASEPRKSFRFRDKALAYVETEKAEIEAQLKLREKLDLQMDTWDRDNVHYRHNHEQWLASRKDEYDRVAKEIGYKGAIVPFWADDCYWFEVKEIPFEE